MNLIRPLFHSFWLAIASPGFEMDEFAGTALRELPQARDTLAALLAKHPDLKQARDLQARLTP